MLQNNNEEIQRQVRETQLLIEQESNALMRQIVQWGKYKLGRDEVRYDRFEHPTSEQLQEVSVQVAKSFLALDEGKPTQDNPVGLLFYIKQNVQSTKQVVDYLCEDEQFCNEQLENLRDTVEKQIAGKFRSFTRIIDMQRNTLASLMQQVADKIIQDI